MLILPIRKLGLFFQILLTAEFAENAEETKSPSQIHQREFLHVKNLRAIGVLGGKIQIGSIRRCSGQACFFTLATN